jgi:hypothetical protein
MPVALHQLVLVHVVVKQNERHPIGQSLLKNRRQVTFGRRQGPGMAKARHSLGHPTHSRYSRPASQAGKTRVAHHV